MSKKWDEIIREIEGRYEKEGFEDFESWSVIQAAMITGDRALEWQAGHMSFWPGDINDISSVVEVGGGFGAMHHLWRNRGYEGDWYSYDYPVMYKLQFYYSQKNGFDFPIWVEPPLEADMFIACFSLSEMDLEEREIAMANAKFKHHIVVYASKWDEVDNREYFSSWPGKEIERPDRKGLFYHVQ